MQLQQINMYLLLDYFAFVLFGFGIRSLILKFNYTRN